ncbi:MAG: hypothetical protein ABH868_04510 [bacterium]
MMKLYCTNDSGRCHPLSHFRQRLKRGEVLEVVEMKRDIGGPMYCSEEDAFVESGWCGKECPDYAPCNGKRGKCRKLKHGYFETDEDYEKRRKKILATPLP